MANSLSTTSSQHPMIIESATDLGIDALQHPGKYAGFMGISVGHKFFSKATMEYFFIWGSQTFKEFLILLMDDPDKYNFMIFENLSEEQALKKAQTIGDERARSYEKVVRKIGVTNIRIVRFRDFNNSKIYTNILCQTKQYAAQDIAFKNELLNLMEEGIGGKIQEYSLNKNLSPHEICKVREILSGYILEEFVSLLYFTENGFPIEVDPTKEFSTKKFVYEGMFNDFKTYLSLTRRGHIFTHPEGVFKSTY